MTAADVAGWLTRLEEVHAAATPGPWFAWDRGVGWHICTEDPETVGRGSVPTTLPEGSRTDLGRAADAAAIVAAHNATPALIAAVRAVLALADELDAEARERYAQFRALHLAERPAAAEAKGTAGTVGSDAAERIRAAVAALGAEVTGR